MKIKMMNKIVREHYPASRLPQELREGMAPGASVKVTVEQETQPALERARLLELMRNAQAIAPGTTLEEAVARIRALRDEWDD